MKKDIDIRPENNCPHYQQLIQRNWHFPEYFMDCSDKHYCKNVVLGSNFLLCKAKLRQIVNLTHFIKSQFVLF